MIVREETIGDCRLILGDCLDVLPTLGRVDAVVTDPPYGISITKSNRLAVSRGMGGKSWDDAPIDAAAVALLRSKADIQIIWGGNYFDLPPTRAPLVWDKNNAGRDFADFELAWSNLDMVARRFVFRPMNMDGGKQHPTQKPIQVMQWCLGFLPKSATHIMDPFMGSGTTGVACARLGLRFTGIEIDPGYFEIACDRIRKAYAQPDMFVAAPTPLPEQLSILDGDAA
jgi:DNA modification methylase